MQTSTVSVATSAKLLSAQLAFISIVSKLVQLPCLARLEAGDALALRGFHGLTSPLRPLLARYGPCSQRFGDGLQVA